LTTEEIRELFQTALKESADRGIEGVTHRDLLNRLHNAAEVRMTNIR